MDHTLSAVDADLKVLSQDVAALGDGAVAQILAAVDVFLRHDLTTALKVVAADDSLDAQDIEIEKRAIRFIALRQPMADDLRRPIAAMKMAMQLERCGDLAKNIAKRVGGMDGRPDAEQAKVIGELGALVAERLAAVIQAYRAGDAGGAHAVWSNDTEVDIRHDEVLQRILRSMTDDPKTVQVSTHLLFIAKNLERIGVIQLENADIVRHPLVQQIVEAYEGDRQRRMTIG